MTDATRLVVYLEPAVARTFIDFARANERSATAEARIALKRHMGAAGIEVPPAATGNRKPAGDAPAGSVAADSNQLVARGRGSARSADRVLEQPERVWTSSGSLTRVP